MAKSLAAKVANGAIRPRDNTAWRLHFGQKPNHDPPETNERLFKSEALLCWSVGTSGHAACTNNSSSRPNYRSNQRRAIHSQLGAHGHCNTGS